MNPFYKIYILIALVITSHTSLYGRNLTLERAQKDLDTAQTALKNAKDQQSIDVAMQKLATAQKNFNGILSQAQEAVERLATFDTINRAIETLEKADAHHKEEKLTALVNEMEKTALAFLEAGNLIVDYNNLDTSKHPLYKKLNDQRKGPFEEAIQRANREIAKYPTFVKKLVEEKIAPLDKKIAHLSDTDLTDEAKVANAVKPLLWRDSVRITLFTPFAEKTHPKTLLALKTLKFDLHKSINYQSNSHLTSTQSSDNSRSSWRKGLIMAGMTLTALGFIYKYKDHIKKFFKRVRRRNDDDNKLGSQPSGHDDKKLSTTSSS